MSETLELLRANVVQTRGAQLGWGRWGRAPPPAFKTLAKDMSLNNGATHFTLV